MRERPPADGLLPCSFLLCLLSSLALSLHLCISVFSCGHFLLKENTMPVVSTKVNPLLAGAPATAGDLEAIARLGQARQKLKEEIAKIIVGQEHIVDDLLTCLFARGHCLMIGVPGL